MTVATVVIRFSVRDFEAEGGAELLRTEVSGREDIAYFEDADPLIDMVAGLVQNIVAEAETLEIDEFDTTKGKVFIIYVLARDEFELVVVFLDMFHELRETFSQLGIGLAEKFELGARLGSRSQPLVTEFLSSLMISAAF